MKSFVRCAHPPLQLSESFLAKFVWSSNWDQSWCACPDPIEGKRFLRKVCSVHDGPLPCSSCAHLYPRTLFSCLVWISLAALYIHNSLFTGTEKRLFCSLQLPFVFEAVITVPPCLFFSLTPFFQVFFPNCLFIHLNRIFIFSSCYCWFLSWKVSMQVGDPRPIVLWLIIPLSAKYSLSLILKQISQKICSVHLLIFTGKQPPGCVYYWALHLLCSSFTKIIFP